MPQSLSMLLLHWRACARLQPLGPHCAGAALLQARTASMVAWTPRVESLHKALLRQVARNQSRLPLHMTTAVRPALKASVRLAHPQTPMHKGTACTLKMPRAPKTRQSGSKA